MKTIRTLSIVIVSFNVVDYVVDCIQSIYDTEPDLDFEIWVVDNDSTDNTIDVLKERFAEHRRLHIIGNHNNRGFGRANNQVIPDINGELVLFLNPDTRLVEKNSLKAMVNYLKKDEKIGICGPRIVFSSGELQLSCGEFPTLTKTILEVFSLPKMLPVFFHGYRYIDWNHKEVKRVDWVSGACLMIKTDLLKRLQGFDETLIMYAEDVDLCARARGLNFDVVYYPFSEIVHFEGQSSKKTRSTAVISGYISKMNFFSKYYGNGSAYIVGLAFIISSMVKIILIFPFSFFDSDNKERLKSYSVALKQLLKIFIYPKHRTER
jgi:hypothetical protein